jgi:hypothetical protein
MKTIRFIAACVALISLGGCITDEQIIAEQTSECIKMGFKPGSQELVLCRMNLETRRQTQESLLIHQMQQQSINDMNRNNAILNGH